MLARFPTHMLPNSCLTTSGNVLLQLRTWPRALAASFLIGPAAARAAPAPTATPATEEVVTLSPFVVEDDSDIGYAASQSTLGGRMKQQLKDVPSQIEVTTPEFMRDFNVTSLEDAFRYSVNVENLEEYVSPQDGGGAYWSGKEVGRIRGIQPSSFSTSRNLFSSITKTDAYNADRFEVGSGAQSLIFSIGEPAGVANIKLKSAQRRNFGSASMTVDSEEGHRFVLDVNRKLWRDKLAARVIVLDENTPSFIKPSYDRDKRIYGTIAARPFANTTLHFHAERMNARSSIPPPQLPFDWATPAYEAMKTGATRDVASATSGAVRDSVAFPGGNNANPLPFYHLSAYQIPTGPGTVAFDPVRFGPAARDPNTGVARVTFSPGNMLLFPEVAAMVGKNFLGEGVRNEFKSKIADALLEHRLLKSLNFEAGLHWEEWRRLQQSYVDYLAFGYNADINVITTTVPWAANRNVDSRILPTAMPAQYGLNPNFGKLYTTGMPRGATNLERTREFRLSLAWEPVTPKGLKWLGEHSLLTSYNHRDSFQKSQALQVRLLGPLAYQNFNGPLNNARRVFLYQHFFDTGANLMAQPPVVGGQPRSLEELLAGGLAVTDPTTGQPIELSGWNSPFGGSQPNGSKTRLESGILAWQGRWFRRLIVNYGLRRDAVANTRMNLTPEAQGGPNQSNGGWRFFDDPQFVTWDDSSRVSYDANSHTYGLTGRPLDWLSLSYYESATFNLPTGQFTAFGDPIPGTAGSSKDYAIRFDSRDGDSYIKLNYYTLQKLATNVGFGSVRIEAARLETSYQKVVDDRADLLGTPGYEQLVVQQGLANPNAWTADKPFGLNSAFHPITGDVTSKGYELTAGTRLGKLDLRLTGARGVTVESNVSRDWESWINARLPVWSDPNLRDLAGNVGWARIPYQGANANNYTIREPNGTLRPMTMKEFYESVTQSALNAALQRNDKPIDAGRKYRVNLNASYHFKEGKLRGVRTGGALRWRSAPVLGFPAEESGIISAGYPVPQIDLDHPYYGKQDFNLDAFAAYSGKFNDRLRYRIQLNARNLLTGKNSFRSSRVNAFGESVFTVIETPRAYSLSLELLF